MAAVVLPRLLSYLVGPSLLINSFNTATDWFVEPRVWGLRHWQNVPATRFVEIPGQFSAYLVIDGGLQLPLPVSPLPVLARTKIPFSHTLEFVLIFIWCRPLPTTIADYLTDPDIGLINVGPTKLVY